MANLMRFGADGKLYCAVKRVSPEAFTCPYCGNRSWDNVDLDVGGEVDDLPLIRCLACAETYISPLLTDDLQVVKPARKMPQ